MIHHILKRLPLEYASFVSSHNTHKLTMGSAFTMPSFDAFAKMLMLEQSKLIDMGILKSSKSTTLVASHENQSIKVGKVLPTTRKRNGSQNHNQR